MFDGVCDSSNKYESCHYDGFDCCLSLTGGLTSESCGSFASCDMAKLEDNQCDQGNNKVECLYDLGSCRNETNHFGCLPDLYSDTVCDLINRHASCDFDGGDCSNENDEGKSLAQIKLPMTFIVFRRFIGGGNGIFIGYFRSFQRVFAKW